MKIFYVRANQIVRTEAMRFRETHRHLYDEGYDAEGVIQEKIKLIQEGRLKPIEVREVTDDMNGALGRSALKLGEKLYYVSDGHHRLEAINRLGIDKVPVFISVDLWK